jgi:hypothetical protein
MNTPNLYTELQALYRFEMNCQLSSFWDGGWTFKLGDSTNGFTMTERFDTLQEVAQFVWELNQQIADDNEEREAEFRAGRF